MPLLRVCAAEGCTTKTLGELCVEHEHAAAADHVPDVEVIDGRAIGDDELALTVAGVA